MVLQSLFSNEDNNIKRVTGYGLVTLIIGDKGTGVIGRKYLRRAEPFAGESTLARPWRAY